MKNFIEKVKNQIDEKFIRYVIAGIINTIFGTSIMFIFYNVLGLSYEVSTASNYVFGGILSFFLSKYFTFKSQGQSAKEVIQFIINIAICYFLAYGLAQPLAGRILAGTGASKKVIDNIAMVIGMILYVALNYIGQRFIVFKEDK